MNHRLTRLRVEGMRTLEKIDLDLNGLRVLIGENGSGKSSILEALEILRRTRSNKFWSELHQIHGGMHALLRYGCLELRLGCTIEGVYSSRPYSFEYEISLSERAIESECITLLQQPGGQIVRIERSRQEFAIHLKTGPSSEQSTQSRIASDVTTLATIGAPYPDPRLALLQRAIERIEVHLPFDVLAAWVARAHGRKLGVRGAEMITATDAVERLGANLASVYQALRNDQSNDEWETTMDWVRLGLGDWVEAINVRADAGSGTVGLWIKHVGLDLKLPAQALSDGQLQFLGLVALCRLTSDASIVAFDEPEAHLHPHLQSRAMQMFQRLSERCPVLIATHSRRILDELDDPATAVRICQAQGQPVSTVIVELDRVALSQWMKQYDGYGKLLNSGYGNLVLREPGPPDSGT